METRIRQTTVSVLTRHSNEPKEITVDYFITDNIGGRYTNKGWVYLIARIAGTRKEDFKDFIEVEDMNNEELVLIKVRRMITETYNE